MMHSSRAGLLSVANPGRGRHAAPVENDMASQVDQLRQRQRETQRQSMMQLQQQYRAHIEGAVATQMADSDDADDQQQAGSPEEPQQPEEKEPVAAAQGGWRQASRRRDIGTGRGFFMPRDIGEDGGRMYWYESNSCYICMQFVPIFSQAQCCNVPAHSDCVAAFPVCYVCGRASRRRATTPPPRRKPKPEQDDGCGVGVDGSDCGGGEVSSVGSVDAEEEEIEVEVESPPKPKASSCCWW